MGMTETEYNICGSCWKKNIDPDNHKCSRFRIHWVYYTRRNWRVGRD